MLSRLLALLAVLAIQVTVLAAPAHASHATLYIYSPVTNKIWYYSTAEDHGGYLPSQRDVAGPTWTGDDYAVYTAATSGAASIAAYVEVAQTNCPHGGPDNYVILQVFSDGAYRGKLSYVHLRSLNVSVGQWIYSSSYTLGQLQNQVSWKYVNGQRVSCWTGPHVHMEKLNGSWTAGSQWQQQQYSTPVVTFLVTGPERVGGETMQQQALRHTDPTLKTREPVR